MSSKGHDLESKRVSGDEAMNEVIRAKAELVAVKRELAAVKKDRDDVYAEYKDLRERSVPANRKSPPAVKRKDDFVRVLCGDVHGSMMDRPAVDAFLDDLKRWNADEVVLGGDIVECGGFLARHHVLGYVSQTSYTYQDDIAAANWFLDRVQEAAPKARIVYLSGNHESRVERWVVDQTMRHERDAAFLRDLIAPQVLLRLQERGIEFFDRSDVSIPGLPPGWIKLGKVFVVHELSGSKNAAREAVASTAGNVCFFHTHREDSSTMVLPGVGLVKAWNPGCLCQRQPLWRHSNPTGWSHGYGVQIVSKSGDFLHLNVPIWEGKSLASNMHGLIK